MAGTATGLGPFSLEKKASCSSSSTAGEKKELMTDRWAGVAVFSGGEGKSERPDILEKASEDVIWLERERLNPPELTRE